MKPGPYQSTNQRQSFDHATLSNFTDSSEMGLTSLDGTVASQVTVGEVLGQHVPNPTPKTPGRKTFSEADAVPVTDLENSMLGLENPAGFEYENPGFEASDILSAKSV